MQLMYFKNVDKDANFHNIVSMTGQGTVMS